ncbi:MAG: zinc-ribbon domain-containing protein [Clostridiales bacterium]|nr:zinc-ribbon domain-containing protein [Clostridiales bacterium]
MIICPKCGKNLDDSAKFCTLCGTALLNTETHRTDPHQGFWEGEASGGEYYSSNNAAKPDMGYPPNLGTRYGKTSEHPTVGEVFSKSFEFLEDKPVKLWGISLLYLLLCALAAVLSILPIISIPLILVLSVGMTSVFLDGYRGKEISPEQLFIGFKNFPHFCGGMAWMALWVFIWALIPAAGIVFAVIKAYSYRFVPYILLASPEISASDALHESMKQTSGWRGKMFGTDIAITACIGAVLLIFWLLSYIPYMGIIFRVIFIMLAVTAGILAPLVFGVIGAVFYDEIMKKEADEQTR